MLNELDKELEARGLRFIRYTDLLLSEQKAGFCECRGSSNWCCLQSLKFNENKKVSEIIELLAALLY